MKPNPSAPDGLALEGAPAVLRGLPVESTTGCAARLASASLQSQRGSRGILRQAPGVRSAAGSLCRPAQFDQLRNDGIAVIALNFNDSPTHGSARSAAFF